MTKKKIHYLRYLTEKREKNEISEAEKNLLEDFLDKEFENAEWDSAKMGSKEAVSAEIFRKIKTNNPVKKSLVNYYKYAAVACIVLMLGLGIMLKSGVDVKDITVTTLSATDSVKLNDGSLVYLAANSVFKYPEQFNGETRSVTLLKGNAFFKVSKDPHHPFIITSANIKTKVLGTSFHISLDKGRSSVTVITGHVQVSSDKQITYLEPNERAVFTTSGLKKQSVSDMRLYSWYKKDIDLSDVTLHKIFTLLNFKYGVNFKPEDKEILNTRITLYIKGGLSLQNILDQINYVTHLKFKQYGNTVVVNH
ncbi:FecR family protein [Pedobacter sp. B4-66]|uniref:FecR family protein n=1 Tax=Pedobacter sp. B4-66 TaxID=2817280 RepID=UPI001BDA6105|nr:FecR family protein [Pedobacter sp. B4-66]